MFTATHENLKAKAGEPVKITFTVTDADGDDVALAGASAIYKLARNAGDAAVLTKTTGDGISVSGNTAIVEFNTDELTTGLTQLLGDFFGQLSITKSGDTLYVAEGVFTIEPVIG